MESINYEEFYNRVGAEIGWDFSQVKCVSEGESWNSYDEVNIHELKEAGFKKINLLDYNAKEYYQTPEDLIFLLKHTPIIPGFGSDSRDFEILSEFIQKNQTEKGICTNSKRYMIIASIKE